jgi:hypothetical protein
MKDVCSQCLLKFDETPIQFHQRMKKSTPKLCRDCNRINHAELRALQRDNDKENPEFRLLKKYMHQEGKISTALVQRKFQLDQQSANDLIDRFRVACTK